VILIKKNIYLISILAIFLIASLPSITTNEKYAQELPKSSATENFVFPTNGIYIKETINDSFTSFSYYEESRYEINSENTKKEIYGKRFNRYQESNIWSPYESNIILGIGNNTDSYTDNTNTITFIYHQAINGEYLANIYMNYATTKGLILTEYHENNCTFSSTTNNNHFFIEIENGILQRWELEFGSYKKNIERTTKINAEKDQTTQVNLHIDINDNLYYNIINGTTYKYCKFIVNDIVTQNIINNIDNSMVNHVKNVISTFYKLDTEWKETNMFIEGNEGKTIISQNFNDGFLGFDYNKLPIIFSTHLTMKEIGKHLLIHFHTSGINTYQITKNEIIAYNSNNENTFIKYKLNTLYIADYIEFNLSGVPYTKMQKITTENIPNNHFPNASFSYNKYIDDFKIIFTCTTISIDGISKVLWNFGDGTNSTYITTLHTYKKEGNYTVTLQIWDKDNDYDYITKIIEIKKQNNTEEQMQTQKIDNIAIIILTNSIVIGITAIYYVIKNRTQLFKIKGKSDPILN